MSTPPGQSSTFIHRLSHTSVGRATGVLSRFLGGASKMQATGRFLRRQLWAWPLIAAVLLGGVGWWTYQAVDQAMRQQRINDLNAMVDASASAVQVWMGEQRINVQLVAADEKIQPLVADLLRLADGTPGAERNLLQAKSQDLLRERLREKILTCGYIGFLVVAPGGTVLAADQDMPVGKKVTGNRREIYDKAMEGLTRVSLPYRSPLLLVDEKGDLRPNLPTMFVVGPLPGPSGKPQAALGLRIQPEKQFTRILQVVRFGKTGESYAFDQNGLLLSQSRFDEQLKQIGLLADLVDSRSILTVEIRDPQVNMAQGERPTVRRPEQPLTRLAAQAVQGKDGYDADGYRDYRGAPSVGAWRWLPEYGMAIATEVDTDEAFQPVYILRRIFWFLMGLLALCAVGIFLAMLFIARQHRALQKATLAARQLGQYALEQKLGAGGMGTVYRARHAMLRRPTAVKLLDVDKISDEAVARFEREVQLTSALTHPNTVAVFDYGRTPDGIFYYAMEYLEGMNLDELVARHGPLPEARMVFILRQACGSLAEAHMAGLVHRDVKPANIVLTQRGGLYDFVKVLDFGLAKALDNAEKANVTSPNALMGTPLYLSPEAVNQPDQVDARSDVYALAAVGYFLLTGTPVFKGASVMEIIMQHAKTAPEPPSARRGSPISPDLENLLLRGLAKAPADRPASAAAMLIELEACVVEGNWSSQEAAAWWADHGKTPTTGDAVTTATTQPLRPGNQPTARPDQTVAYQERPGA